MPDKFSIIPIEKLYSLIISGYEKRKEVFGIPEKLFFKPTGKENYRSLRFGKTLETPLGVAAGPHTQMAQNIISAWLCGARYIELKTIQTLDELHISKPCIDMQDEGYNCEWSQELKIKESYEEYLKAWIIIHVLRHILGFNRTADPGFIFNMSAGYDLKGIMQDNVQWFFGRMQDCSKEKKAFIRQMKPLCPEIGEIEIPDCIADNITLSTMHGCPPEEIEKIGMYLIREKKLHTTIKFNPTLLGAARLREILNEKLGFRTEVPDLAFEHDLKYERAKKLIINLTKAAEKEGGFFGLKLTNTLESINHKTVFPTEEKMMYMSGRALHPISINLAKKLQEDFNGMLDISFSAGADCFNIRDILDCGLTPVTVCSDILKPGGYGRLAQYLNELKGYKKNGDALGKLQSYSEQVLNDLSYRKDLFSEPSIKTGRALGKFDCIHAPCVNTCPTNQDIPDYLYHAAKGDFDSAYEVIMKKNPFPNVLGTVCDHDCQSKCTRINYDSALLIRNIKRFIAENGKLPALVAACNNGLKVSVIGAGPSGLACAYFLRLAGFQLDVYETRGILGGMAGEAIPAFRLKSEAIRKDIDRICSLGVKIHYNHEVNSNVFEKIKSESDYVYIATGAGKFRKMGIPGEDSLGVLDPFVFLSSVKKGKTFELGGKILVIGGGNTAMDVARTARRLACLGADVTVVYRRTVREMPAASEEIRELAAENIKIIELASPTLVLTRGGRVISLICSQMKPGVPDSSGRPQPEPIEGSSFELAADTIIPALGQDVLLDFIDRKILRGITEPGETGYPNVFIGGDALNGAASIVKAVGDARRTAAMIMKKAGIDFSFEPGKKRIVQNYTRHIVERSTRIKRNIAEVNKQDTSFTSDDSSPALSAEEVMKEASRCLQCDQVCSICVTVCPNRANHTWFVKPARIELEKVIRNNGDLKVLKDGFFEIKQAYQVINIGDFCNECGNCTTFCPTKGSPFRDKPRFYLTLKSFREAEEGYTLSRTQDKLVMISKRNNEISTLTYQDDQYIYENDKVRALFEKNSFRLMEVQLLSDDASEVEFRDAAELFILSAAAKEII